MTKNTVKRADITLPLLIEYVEALLPSLTTQTEQSSDHNKDNNEALWVTHNNADLLALQAQLDDTTSTNENTEAKLNARHLSTLSDLAKQHVPDRYELACFWLPTLSAELTQHYVPLLMRYRDLYAAHLLIALDSSINLKPYGFTPFDILNEPSLNIDDIQSITSSTVTATLWQFNLYDYKQLPNWLNADYWANPENWGKHRW
ncbi:MULTISPECIES: DUF6231 family protein [Psychrobacter]|uniref:DUF6231 family protein n=1 Tax=Psychrobacter TaxID=497 RepID=UPI000C322589|nr:MULTISPECIES: DUF6231 family protein [Psychrobacter]MBA6243196.1 hypothetical protein [Psychrobacter sp. Urea-trap-18]MBA6286254.1 hypothetical protein [Psychrobacter sp. Urea-trap-16]MBA6317403.1 hypothetical protein [Psychrobacter sp. Urea-trap-20]MBA6334569.1 hypothetical protein [Psychrobacter sp. Urea-trap-19]PKG60887.1 hypothetical protein CXF63_05300 [Psychrobacter sp. Choline-3u-12]